MPSYDSPSVLYAHYGFRSGPRRFGTRPFNFVLASQGITMINVILQSLKIKIENGTIATVADNEQVIAILDDVNFAKKLNNVAINNKYFASAITNVFD